MKEFRRCSLVIAAFLLAEPSLLQGQESVVTPLSTDLVDSSPSPTSSGFRLSEVRFDPNDEVPNARERSGAVFQSFRPGSVWVGTRPEFIVPTVEVGGEERLECTDVFASQQYLLAHYGYDHYQTKAVSIVDKNRKEVAFLTGFAYEDLSRVFFDSEKDIVYFTTLEHNLRGAEKARLVAYSLGGEKVLWRSDAGTAHGDFLVYEKHILTHYGFSGEDDFVCVIDRGSGKTLKKLSIATAASHLIETEEDLITVPCYTGVLTLRFEEE